MATRAASTGLFRGVPPRLLDCFTRISPKTREHAAYVPGRPLEVLQNRSKSYDCPAVPGQLPGYRPRRSAASAPRYSLPAPCGLPEGSVTGTTRTRHGSTDPPHESKSASRARQSSGSPITSWRRQSRGSHSFGPRIPTCRRRFSARLVFRPRIDGSHHHRRRFSAPHVLQPRCTTRSTLLRYRRRSCQPQGG